MPPLTVSAERAEKQLVGQALRNIRERRRPRMTQSQIGRALGMTGANWQQYEAGVRAFGGDVLERAIDALGSSRGELDKEIASLLGRAHEGGVQEEPAPFLIDVFGRVRAGPQGIEVYDAGEPLRQIDLRQILGRGTDALEVAGESMMPWAEPGEVVLFDRDRYPRRGAGCVIETHDGQYYVKLYERVDGSTLFVRELFPEDRIIQFPLSRVRGIYGVRLRGD